MAPLTGPVCGYSRRVGKGKFYSLLYLHLILQHRDTSNATGFVVLMTPVIVPGTS
jgi:hypothetical protein